MLRLLYFLFLILVALPLQAQKIEQPTGDELLGVGSYYEFENPKVCGSCHVDIYQQWLQAMMSQSYTHHWDEIEYFKLAVPHAEKVEVILFKYLFLHALITNKKRIK